MSKGRNRRQYGRQYNRRWLYAPIVLLFGIILFFRVQDESPERFPVLDLHEHPLGSATPYVPDARRFPAFYFVHTNDDQVYAIVRLAPGSGCLVVWDEKVEAFEDPCTGNRYDWDGTSLVGDDVRGLMHLPVERSQIDRVMIDLGHRLANPYDQKGS